MPNAIKRLALWFKIYSLDITIAGQTDCLRSIANPFLKYRIELARSNARRERNRLRVAYSALLPVLPRIQLNIAKKES